MPRPRAIPRTAPFTPGELRQMLREGDSVSQIYARANRIDRSVTKPVLREILFGAPR